MKKVVVYVGLCLILCFPACSIFQPRKERDIVRLESRIAETNEKLEQIYQSVSKILAMVGSHETAISNIEQKIGIQRPSLASAPEIQKPPKADDSGGMQAAYGGKDPIHLYQQALAAFNRGDKSAAKSLFDRFARNYPDHEKSPYAVSWIRYIDTSGLKESRVQQQAPRPAKKEASPGGIQIQPPARKELYNEALGAFQRRRYKDALPLFQTFLNDHPGHYLADNSLYWIGECQYAMKNYHTAANTFKAVIDRFPDGNKIPDATLKTGLCYYMISDLRNARLYFQRVVDFYSSSSAAPVARRKLDEINERLKNHPDSENIDSLQVYISESQQD